MDCLSTTPYLCVCVRVWMRVCVLGWPCLVRCLPSVCISCNNIVLSRTNNDWRFVFLQNSSRSRRKRLYVPRFNNTWNAIEKRYLTTAATTRNEVRQLCCPYLACDGVIDFETKMTRKIKHRTILEIIASMFPLFLMRTGYSQCLGVSLISMLPIRTLTNLLSK